MRVGTRYKTSASGDTRKDHPHACGDKNIKTGDKVQVEGSSPCVWGQAVNDIVTVPFSRIIPMRVGTSADFFFSLLCE